LIEYGVIPAPKQGLFGFRWPKLVKDDRVQSAQTASVIASALSTAGIDIEPDEFVRVYTPEINVAKIAKKEIPAPLVDPLPARQTVTHLPARGPFGRMASRGVIGPGQLARRGCCHHKLVVTPKPVRTTAPRNTNAVVHRRAPKIHASAMKIGHQ
jgi:hypothetical protein